ncbi:phospholipid scramblase family protein C343.06c-like isoform X2 [Punica granatum]|uniref:Phospholipid scramblase n=1 Tax=Punica granatum TaxID=22663 RepID=A0A6P8DU71_PUNGR|nr:phospholipid scramblase family protein C343.06c-like isoform X2 [Punica granatum]
MEWYYLMMGWQCLSKLYKTSGISTIYGALFSLMARACRPENSTYVEKFPQPFSGKIQSLKPTSLLQGVWGCGMIEYEKRSFLLRNRSGNIEDPCGFEGNSLFSRRTIKTMSHQVGNGTDRELQLSRDFSVQLWVSDKKMNEPGISRRRKLGKQKNSGVLYVDQISLQHLAERWFYGDSTIRTNSEPHRQDPQQPPPSQPVSSLLKLASPEEALVAPLLARSNLLITRDIEWANLVLGFKQEHRYAIVDVCYPQSPVGFIREQSNVVVRQFLRLRRPFVAYITDAMGNELYRVRRPFWWITSSIYAEVDGKEVGVVHQRWHLWKRVYDLNKQFAVVENPGFWFWTFTLKDINGEVLAEIDRAWRGFGFELFTDAGQYVIRFGSSDPFLMTGCARKIRELKVVRPLTLSERAVALALAVSLDNDYFSRHGDWGIPFAVGGD